MAAATAQKINSVSHFHLNIVKNFMVGLTNVSIKWEVEHWILLACMHSPS